MRADNIFNINAASVIGEGVISVCRNACACLVYCERNSFLVTEIVIRCSNCCNKYIITCCGRSCVKLFFICGIVGEYYSTEVSSSCGLACSSTVYPVFNVEILNLCLSCGDREANGSRLACVVYLYPSVVSRICKSKNCCVASYRRSLITRNGIKVGGNRAVKLEGDFVSCVSKGAYVILSAGNAYYLFINSKAYRAGNTEVIVRTLYCKSCSIFACLCGRCR